MRPMVDFTVRPVEPGELRHTPVEQRHIGGTAALKIEQRLVAIAKAGNLVSFIDQIESKRLTEQIIIVDKKEVRHRRRF